MFEPEHANVYSIPRRSRKLQNLSSSDETASRIAEFRSLAERALEFQKFIVRRTWAVYYSAWAVAVSLFFFVPYFFTFF